MFSFSAKLGRRKLGKFGFFKMILRAILTAAILIVVSALLLATKRSQLKSQIIRNALFSLYCIGGVLLIVIVIRRPLPNGNGVDGSDGDGEQVSIRAVDLPSDGYVGSQVCRDCHLSEYDSWHASFHRTMTQVVGPETVMGDFDNVTLHDRNQEFVLSRRGDDFVAEFDEPMLSYSAGSPVRVERKMVMSTGSHHMQMYWYPVAPNSRLVGLFPFAYLQEDQRWVPRDSVFLQPHLDQRTVEIGRWNKGCIRCHATHGKAGIEIEMTENGEKYNAFEAKTSVVEFGISCEECHGPGEMHVSEFSEGNSVNPGQSLVKPYIVHPGRLPAERSVQICGQCHGLFDYLSKEDREHVLINGETFRPGDDLAASRILLRSIEDYESPEFNRLGGGIKELVKRCWSDGMVRVSGREYNGVIRSPCFKGGKMTCITCHQMHRDSDDPRPIDKWTDDQLMVDMRTNKACTQCHQSFDDSDVLVQHTHHAADSSGSNCYNCHASYTTYGLLKAIRSHQIESPDVAVALQTGRPNACNQCHLDQTLAWTADHLQRWYEISPPKLSDDDRQVAASVQWLLKGDAGQRALMAWSYGWSDAQQAAGTQWMAPYLGQLLEDPYDAVRYIAQRSLNRIPGFEEVEGGFLGNSAQQKESHASVLTIWSQQTGPPQIKNVLRLLIDSEGNIMTKRFDELLRQRDDREVRLLE